MKNFKKLAAFGLTAALSLSLLTACGGGTTGTTETPANTETPASTESTAPETETPTADGTFTTVEDGKLIMSTNATFPPYEMVADGDGVNGSGYEGIDIEIAYALADKLGLELVINDMDFDAALLAVQNNSADMMLAGLSYSEERDEVVDFSDPYATGVQVVIVKEGSDVTLDNLGDGKLIGTQRGTTGYIYASDTPENGGYGEDAVKAFDSGATAVQALVNGQVDAVIIDEAPAKEFVAANEGLTILPGEWVTEDYCIAVAEGNTQLQEAIQKALDELIADGTVDSIINSHIKAD